MTNKELHAMFDKTINAYQPKDGALWKLPDAVRPKGMGKVERSIYEALKVLEFIPLKGSRQMGAAYALEQKGLAAIDDSSGKLGVRLAKSSIVYKVVQQDSRTDGSPHYFFSLAHDEPEIRRYSCRFYIGRVTYPKIGYLYAWYNLEDALKYQGRYFSGASVIKCRAELVTDRTETYCKLGRDLDIFDFWQEALNGQMESFRDGWEYGTCFMRTAWCKWLVPIEKIDLKEVDRGAFE